jgi:putative ABC transport system substrate-binding protein
MWMRRREFITLVGGTAATWPGVLVAQQQPRKIIGYLSQESAAFDRDDGDSAAFLNGLRELGYVDDRGLQIEFRYADNDLDRLSALAADLVGLNVDVLVTYATGTFAARSATTTIPIVQVVGSDLVSIGFAQSLAHPGGNITGSTFFVAELMAKRLELLEETLPSLTSAGVLTVLNNPSTPGILAAVGSAGKALGGNLLANMPSIAALAARHRLASIGPLELPASGGMIGYGVKFSDFFHRAAFLVDKILKGTKVGDIPIEQATKFKSVVNLNTAKALGLEVPGTVLARADEVIE